MDSSEFQIKGHGKFSGQIVGESHYQENLEKICGGRSSDGVEVMKPARLIYEDSNPYDDKAVRVDIDGMTVGYLSREQARFYRLKMEMRGVAGKTAICGALITGGWDMGSGNKGSFGVRLDAPSSLINQNLRKQYSKSNSAVSGGCCLVIAIIVIIISIASVWWFFSL